MKTGVFLCTCSETINIDFKRLRKGIDADVIEINEMLCHDKGLAKLKEIVKTQELGHVLVACTLKRQRFDTLGLELDFINLKEFCGRVHKKSDATEKARVMVNETLAYPDTTENIFREVGRNVLITGDIKAVGRIAQYISKFGKVHIVNENSGNFLDLESGIKTHVGSVRNIAGRIGDFRVSIIENIIDSEKCISCGRCLEACPINEIYEYPVFAAGEGCDKCGKCIHVCPAHAISLRDNVRTIKAGQILVIGEKNRDITARKKGIFVTEIGETAGDTLRNALPEALQIISNMNGIEQEKHLSVSMKVCASGKSGFSGCRLCEKVCSSRAINRNGDSIMFDEISCDGCCACVSACPISNFQPRLDIYSKLEFLIKNSQLSPNILMFTCWHSITAVETAGRKNNKYPPVLPLFVPCIAGVSEVHILRALDLGVDGVIILGCRDCLLRSNETLLLAELISKEFGLHGRMITISNDDSFVESVTAFSKHLMPSPLKSKEPVILKKAYKRQDMLDILRGFAAKTGIIPDFFIKDKEYPFAVISINRNCTVCDACTAMCPTEAINRDGNSILFTYGDCIACGLCEKACPETAIKIHKAFDLAKLVHNDRETLFQTEMQECSACKRPYMTVAAYDRIAGSLILNARNDLEPHEQVELITGQLELLKFCEQCRPVRAISKLEMFS